MQCCRNAKQLTGPQPLLPTQSDCQPAMGSPHCGWWREQRRPSCEAGARWVLWKVRDWRWSLVAVLHLISPRNTSFFADYLSRSVSPTPQPSRAPSLGQGLLSSAWPLGRPVWLRSCTLATVMLHLIPSTSPREVTSVRLGGDTWFRYIIISKSLWQESLFTFRNYLKVSLLQTPGTCCHI